MCTLTHRDSALPRLPRVAEAVQADGDLRVAPVVVVIAGLVTVVASAITLIASDVRQPDPRTPQVFCHSSNTHSKVSDKYPHGRYFCQNSNCIFSYENTNNVDFFNSPNPKDASFTASGDKEKQHMLTFKKLQQQMFDRIERYSFSDLIVRL